MTNEEFFDEIFDVVNGDAFTKYIEKVKKCQIRIKHK